MISTNLNLSNLILVHMDDVYTCVILLEYVRDLCKLCLTNCIRSTRNVCVYEYVQLLVLTEKELSQINLVRTQIRIIMLV